MLFCAHFIYMRSFLRPARTGLDHPTTVGTGLPDGPRHPYSFPSPLGETKAPSGRELSAVRLTEGVPGSDNRQVDKLYSCFVSYHIASKRRCLAVTCTKEYSSFLSNLSCPALLPSMACAIATSLPEGGCYRPVRLSTGALSRGKIYQNRHLDTKNFQIPAKIWQNCAL